MRRTGHTIDQASLRDALADYRKELSLFEERRPEQLRRRNPRFFTGNARNALSVARIAYVFGEPLAEIRRILSSFLREVATAVDLGGIVQPLVLTQFLGTALWTEDDEVAAWLSALQGSVYEDPDGVTSPGALHYVRAFQAAASGDAKALTAAVKKFRSVLVPEKLLEPRAELAIYKPLLELLEAIAVRDQVRFEEAWKAQADAWKKRFGRPSEKANYDGLLDFEALGLAVLARRAGLQVPDTNPYAPLELLDLGAKKKK